MTTRQELDARLAEFDRRREVADAVLAGWTRGVEAPEPINQQAGPMACTGRLRRWLSLRSGQLRRCR